MKMSVQITPAMEVIGNGVGAVLQVREVLRVLQQHPERPKDLEAKTLFLAAKILEAIGFVKGLNKHKKALALAKEQLISGKAWEMMQRIIKAQGGNPEVSSESLSLGTHHFEVIASQDGKVQEINLHHVNQIARRLGCPSVNEAGMYLHKKLQDPVKKGEILYTMYAQDAHKIQLAQEQEAMKPAFRIV